MPEPPSGASRNLGLSTFPFAGVGFVLGVAGSSFAVGVPFVARWYGRERQGFAVGVHGVATSAPPSPRSAPPRSWTGFGRPALGLFAGAILVAEPPPEDSPGRRGG